MKSVKKNRELLIIAIVVVIAIAVCVVVLDCTEKKEDKLPELAETSTTVVEPTTNGTTAYDVEDIEEEEVPPDALEPTAPEEEETDEEKMEVFSKISKKVDLVQTMIDGIDRDSEGRLHYRSPYGKTCWAYIDDSVVVLEGKMVPDEELTPYIHTSECPGDCLHRLTGEMLTHGSVWEAGTIVSIDGVRVIVGE